MGSARGLFPLPGNDPDASLRGRDWIEQQWEAARLETGEAGKRGTVLVLDAIQKIPNWSQTVKL